MPAFLKIPRENRSLFGKEQLREQVVSGKEISILGLLLNSLSIKRAFLEYCDESGDFMLPPVQLP